MSQKSYVRSLRRACRRRSLLPSLAVSKNGPDGQPVIFSRSTSPCVFCFGLFLGSLCVSLTRQTFILAGVPIPAQSS